MKITKRQLRILIREEKQRLLSEEINVPQGMIERLNDVMMEIFYAVEAEVEKNPEVWHPDDIPLYVNEIIEDQVAGFAEWLGSGMES